MINAVLHSRSVKITQMDAVIRGNVRNTAKAVTDIGLTSIGCKGHTTGKAPGSASSVAAMPGGGPGRLSGPCECNMYCTAMLSQLND